jgi:hypothetical protein
MALPSASAWSCNDDGATEVLTKVPLGHVDALAVCNDGSEAAYYFKDNGNPSLWVVYLGGGGWCYDEKSCAGRFDGSGYPHHDCSNSSEASPCFMSSKDYPQECAKTGLFDVDENHTPLAKANKIYVPYCSSDGHMGDGEHAGFQFRGARIARAVVTDLQTRGLGRGSTLVWSGGSAGGRGAMVLLDEMAESLPDVNVVGYLDSNYYIDVPSNNPDFAGFQMQHVGVLQNFNASSVISDACAAANNGELWKCLFGQYRMLHIKTPYLMVAAQFDGWQLSHLVEAYDGIDKSPSFTDDQTTYVDAFGLKTAVLSQTLPSATTPWAVVYSTACYNHHISEKSNFWTVTTSDGMSQNNALHLLLHDDHRHSRIQLIDDCEGYECGSGCHPAVSVSV